MLMVSCQKGPTRRAYAWQIGPFWQDTLGVWNNHLYIETDSEHSELILTNLGLPARDRDICGCSGDPIIEDVSKGHPMTRKDAEQKKIITIHFTGRVASDSISHDAHVTSLWCSAKCHRHHNY